MKSIDMRRLADNIENIAEYDFSNNKVFGSAYYVYSDGENFEKCYGNLSIDSDKQVTNNTVFRLASMTKPITAVASLVLSERGRLSLDDSVDKFIPEFADIMIKDVTGNSVKPCKIPTVKDILTHTSGIGCVPEKLNCMTSDDKLTHEAAIKFCLKNGLDFEPNSMQRYSGWMAFDVLTKIIEIVSQTDFLSFLKKEIFDVCGMFDTTFEPSDEQKSRMITMHNKVDGKNAVGNTTEGCVFENFPCNHYLGGAGLVSTLSDYSKFARMLLDNGKAENGRIIKEDTIKQMYTPWVPKEIMNGNERWGLGVRVISEDAYPTLPKGAYGWSGAYGSHFWIDPVNNICAVFMKNSRFDGGAANESARNFEKAVYSSF